MTGTFAVCVWMFTLSLLINLHILSRRNTPRHVCVCVCVCDDTWIQTGVHVKDPNTPTHFSSGAIKRHYRPSWLGNEPKMETLKTSHIHELCLNTSPLKPNHKRRKRIQNSILTFGGHTPPDCYFLRT